MESEELRIMPMLAFQIGQQVAIFPMNQDADSAVQELAGVIFADSFLVRLSNGQVFSQRNGHGISSRSYIVPATELHRSTLDQRWN
jgi:hypothetical protein